MGAESYGSICIEGGDHLGKGDATSKLREGLELEGINTTYVSFQIYSTPLGTCIRSMLKDGSISEKTVSKENNLEIRMALFALNRLEFLDIYLSEPKYWNTLLLFDRSSFSNAVTIGYGISLEGELDRRKMQEYINIALDLDSLMISKLGLDRCIVQLKMENREWMNMREKEADIHEKKEVQERTSEVYGMYKEIFREQWHEVITRDENDWRSREEIFENIHNILLSTYGDMGEIRQGSEFKIDFGEVVDSLYPKAEYNKGDYLKYKEALKNNDKPNMYLYGMSLGKSVAKSCINIRFSNKEVQDEFRRIISIVPQVMNVYEYFLGKVFVNKLRRALDLW